MSLKSRVQKLKQDIIGREHTISISEKLISEWKNELSATEKKLRLEISKESAEPSIRHGIDFAYGSPNASPYNVKRLGISFVCRYYSFYAEKNLSRHEAENWSHIGVDIISVWEATGHGSLLGYDGGVSAAKAALSLAHDIGQPDTTPIFFAVDFEPLASDWTVIEGYFKGCSDILGKNRVGIYGGYSTIEQAYLKNFASYYWQTLAWSGGKWYPHAHLRQVSVDNIVDGISCDMDVSLTHNFGQWRL